MPIMGAIQTDVAQIRLTNPTKNCHFDRREKSAARLYRMQSRFLPTVEMTVLVCCVYHFESHLLVTLDNGQCPQGLRRAQIGDRRNKSH